MKLLASLLLCALTCPLLAAEAKRPPVPKNARAQAESPRKTWLLGENILIHFKLENAGGDPFTAEFGGDYRGAGFATRFKLKVTNEKGEVMPDLNHENHMGGLGGDREITPNSPFWGNLSLLDYTDITEPGVYDISITHDFGWADDPKGPRPSAKIRLTVKEPTEQKAAELTKAWLALPEDSGHTFGEKGTPHPDFGLIRHPAYLKPLKEVADQGNPRGVTGLASILTPEATRALLAIAGDAKNPNWNQALREVSRRLPRPKNQAHWFGSKVWIKKLEASWVPALEPDARKAARNLMANSKTYHPITNACSVLASIGTPKDAKALRATIDRECNRKNKLAEHQTQALLWHLKNAAEALVRRGAEIEDAPNTAGGRIFYLARLATEKDSNKWPKNWRRVCQRTLAHPNPHLQRLTLETLPAPLDPVFHPNLTMVLRSRHPETASTACSIVHRDKLESFTEEVLKISQRTKQNEVLEDSVPAAVAVGAGWDAAQILVERISEQKMAGSAIRQLLPIVFSTGFHGWNSHDFDHEPYQERWRKVVAKQEQDIRAGKRLAVPHPLLTRDLIPPRFSLGLPDGKSWPPYD